jgi:single-strand DNA-binding protein
MQDNTVTIVGNMTRDCEIKEVSGGIVATFGVAVNRTWTDKASQERKEQTGFYDVVVWGDMGANAATTLARGDRVIVTGRLDFQSWEKDGQKQSRVQIVADDVGPSLKWATASIKKAVKKSEKTVLDEDF